MKKSISALLLLVSGLTMYGNTVFTASYDNNQLRVNYDLRSLTLTSHESDEYSFQCDGFGLVHTEGKGEVLYRNESFPVPVGSEIQDIKVDAVVDTIRGRCLPAMVSSVVLDQSASANEEFTALNSTLVRQAATDIMQEEWPVNNIVMGESKHYLDNEIGRFTVYPVRYNNVKNEIYVCRSLELTVTFTVSKARSFTVESSPEDVDLLSSMTTISVPTLLPPPIITPVKYVAPYYLVLSPRKDNDANFNLSMANIVKDYVSAKTLMGLNVRVREISDAVRLNPDAVKNVIEEEYASQPFTYLCILGDAELIKPFKGSQTVRYYNNIVDYYTDSPYGYVESSNVPVIRVGRIPASNIAQFKTMLSKITEYELNPCTGEDAYQDKAYLFSEFEIDDESSTNPSLWAPNSKDKSNFIREAEYARTLLDDYGVSNKHYIYKPSTAIPTYYQDGSVIPTALLENNPNVVFGSNAEIIASKFNEGCSTILLRGHGNYTTFSHASFNYTHIDALKNGKKLPVVIDISCENGVYYNFDKVLQSGEKPFIQSLLANENGGAVGAVGAGELSWQTPNSYLVAAIYNCIYPGDGFRDYQYSTYPVMYALSGNMQYRLGDVLFVAKNMVSEIFQDLNKNSEDYQLYAMNNENYHCFGDPTMYIQKDAPLKKPLNIEYSNGKYIYKEQKRTLYIQDKTTKKVEYFSKPYGSDLLELMETYDLFTADYGYVPETISLESLKTYSLGGEIINISSTAETVQVDYTLYGDDENENVEVVTMDIMGNKLSQCNGENGSATVPRYSGFMVVTLCKDGQIIDSRAIK